MTFSELCTFEVLYKAYKRARIGKRGKAATAQYEAQALACTEKLAHILQTKKYVPSKFELFFVYEPKKRQIQAPAFVDKVVQHALVDNILYDAITKSFIYDSYASQIGKGTHFGLDRLTHFMRDYYNKHRTVDGWVLKADVRKFFASIPHDLLKEKLRKVTEDDQVYELMCTYIDTTPGLPLGYQTSQLLALLYLDGLDHFIKEKLRIKYYGRYMDDFFLIHEDKEYLKYCLKEIKAYLADLKLELNEKTGIFPMRNGIDFLGFHTYVTETGKVIRKLRRSSIKRMNGKLKWWTKLYAEGKITRKDVWPSFQSWDAHAAHGDTLALRQKYRARFENIFKEVNHGKRST